MQECANKGSNYNDTPSSILVYFQKLDANVVHVKEVWIVSKKLCKFSPLWFLKQAMKYIFNTPVQIYLNIT